LAVFLETKSHSFSYNIQHHGMRAVGLTWLLLPHHLFNGQFMLTLKVLIFSMFLYLWSFCVLIVYVFYVAHVSLKGYGFYFSPLTFSCVCTPYARHWIFMF